MRQIVIALTVLVLVAGSSMAQDCKKCNYWLGEVDGKLSCPNATRYTPTDQETLGLMKCLIRNKGRKANANTLTASRSLELSQTFGPPPIEVASLYYISYLIYQNEDFAMAIALRSGEDKINSKKAVKVAYKAYESWLKKIEEIGLGKAREQKLDPLEGLDVYWY